MTSSGSSSSELRQDKSRVALLRETLVKLRPQLLLALLLVTFVALRLLAIEADPPSKLPGGVPTRELWAEGAAKAHEARNYALFGRWQTNLVDNYQFWRPQAPVWVYSLAGFFKVLGVSIATARLHSVVVATAGFGICVWYARQSLSRFGLVALGVFLGCNYFYIQYTRVGLLEPMVNMFAAATVLCCYRVLSSPSWLTAATVSFLLCVFSKMTGLVLAPILLLCGFLGLRRAGLTRSELGWALLPSLALLVAAAVFMSSDRYLERVIWNVAHAAYAEEGGTSVDASRIDAYAIFERYISGKRWERIFLFFPVASLLCVPALLWAAWDFWRTRTLSWDVLTALWLVAMHAALQLSPLTDVRFSLTVFPPLALLGARGLELCLSWLRRWPVLATTLGVASLLLSLSVDLPRQLAWFRSRTYAVRDANQRVAELIGPRPDTVVVGLWAPWLTLQTPYKFYVVRDRFNVSKPALARLGITHLLLAPGDRSGKHVQKSFPRQFRSKRALGSFRVYTQTLTLFELTERIR